MLAGTTYPMVKDGATALVGTLWKPTLIPTMVAATSGSLVLSLPAVTLAAPAAAR